MSRHPNTVVCVCVNNRGKLGQRAQAKACDDDEARKQELAPLRGPFTFAGVCVIGKWAGSK